MLNTSVLIKEALIKNMSCFCRLVLNIRLLVDSCLAHLIEVLEMQPGDRRDTTSDCFVYGQPEFEKKIIKETQ